MSDQAILYGLWKEKIWEIMKEMKLHRAEVSFSGGGDEGGVDAIVVHGPGRKKRNLDNNCQYDPATGSYGAPEGDRESELYELLSKPVDDEYGSFAGEYFVSGLIVYRLKDKSVEMDGDEEVRESRPISRSY